MDGSRPFHHRADDDHREFQPLGLVNGHHPHSILRFDNGGVHASIAHQLEVVQERIQGTRLTVFVEGSDELAEHTQVEQCIEVPGPLAQRRVAGERQQFVKDLQQRGMLFGLHASLERQ